MFSSLMYKPFPSPHPTFSLERERETETWVVVSRRLRMKKPCLDAKIKSFTWKRQCLSATPLPLRTLLTPRILRTPMPPLATMLTVRFLTTTTTRTWPLLCLLLLLLVLLHNSLSLHLPPPQLLHLLRLHPLLTITSHFSARHLCPQIKIQKNEQVKPVRATIIEEEEGSEFKSDDPCTQ